MWRCSGQRVLALLWATVIRALNVREHVQVVAIEDVATVAGGRSVLRCYGLLGTTYTCEKEATSAQCLTGVPRTEPDCQQPYRKMPTTRSMAHIQTTERHCSRGWCLNTTSRLDLPNGGAEVVFDIFFVKHGRRLASDFMFISLVGTGGTLVLPEVLMLEDRIHVSVTLHDKGEYQVFALLAYVDWPAPHGCQQWTRSLVNVLAGAPAASQITVHADWHPTPGHFRACSAQEAFRGRWQNAQAPHGVISRATAAEWVPVGCTLHPAVVALLDNRSSHLGGAHTIFMGDSTLEVAFKWILSMRYRIDSHGPGFGDHLTRDPYFVDSNCIESNSHSRFRLFDWRDRPGDASSNSRHNWTFLYNGAESPCGNCLSMSFRWEKSLLLRRVRKLAQDDRQNCQRTVLLINSGLHDLCSPEFTFHDYRLHVKDRLRSVLRVLKEVSSSPVTKPCQGDWEPAVAWVATQPKFDRFMCVSREDFPAYVLPYEQSTENVLALNSIAADVCAALDIPVLDAFTLRYANPFDGDGHHCESDYWKTEGFDGQDTPTNSCNWLARMLLYAVHALSNGRP
jgi:hypothetical protein